MEYGGKLGGYMVHPNEGDVWGDIPTQEQALDIWGEAKGFTCPDGYSQHGDYVSYRMDSEYPVTAKTDADIARTIRFRRVLVIAWNLSDLDSEEDDHIFYVAKEFHGHKGLYKLFRDTLKELAGLDALGVKLSKLKPTRTKECAHCGIEFKTRSANSRYCSLCCNKKARAARRAEGLPPKPSKKCAICGEYFTINRLSTQMYCGEACAGKAQRQREKEKRVTRASNDKLVD